jgi:hypothetical protein
MRQKPPARVLRSLAGLPGLAGVVYKIDNSGQETVFYSFTGYDGAYPAAGVIVDAAGTLYGTTTLGGTSTTGESQFHNYCRAPR